MKRNIQVLATILTIGGGFGLFVYTKNQPKTMIEFMQAYIRVNTAQPTPDYAQARKLFKAQAKSDGFLAQEVPLPSGNTVLVVTYPGTDKSLPALALNHHMDVVPIGNRADWKYEPFGGVIENDIIYGRGTQDMKGIGVAQYYALKQLKDEGVKLSRTVHLLMVPDEEVGGFKGVNEFVKTEFFPTLTIGFVLDEGVSSGKPDTLLIKVGERKPIQIRITSKGDEGHGSKINCCNASANLAQFLARIAEFQEQQKEKARTTDPGLLLSMNITSLQSGASRNGKIALNVVPNTATATVDIRVPPLMTMQEAREQLERMLSDFPTITYEVAATIEDPKHTTSHDTLFYRTLVEAIEKNGLKTENFYFEATTDVRYYLAQGIEGLGITPFTCKENLHGVDESITIKDLELGQKFFYTLIHSFCK